MVRKNHFPLGSWNRNLVLLYSVGTLPWLTGWKWEWICHSFFFPSPWHLCWLSETAILFVRRRCQRHQVLQRNKEIFSERQEIIQLTTISCSHGKSSTNANAWVPLIRRHCLAFEGSHPFLQSWGIFWRKIQDQVWYLAAGSSVDAFTLWTNWIQTILLSKFTTLFGSSPQSSKAFYRTEPLFSPVFSERKIIWPGHQQTES